MEGSTQSFKEKLDREHSWPTVYMFKFIVPKGQEDQVYKVLSSYDVSSKASKNGNYVSVTAKSMMASSDEVIKIYKEAHKIAGIIAL